MKELRVRPKGTTKKIISLHIDPSGSVNTVIPGTLNHTYTIPRAVATGAVIGVADGTTLRSDGATLRSVFPEGQSLVDLRTLNGQITIGDKTYLVNDQSISGTFGLINRLIPGQYSDIIGRRPIRPFTAVPVKGGGGGDPGNPNNDPDCDANYDNPPCYDPATGLVVITSVTANGIGNCIDEGCDYAPYDGDGLTLHAPTGTATPPGVPGVLQISCYAGLISSALTSAAAVGGKLWTAVKAAAGGDFEMGELTTWSAADILELAADAIACIGLSEWIVIILAVFAAAGIAYSLYECAKG